MVDANPEVSGSQDSGVPARAANSEGGQELPEHPESVCHRCGGPNIVWHAPSPLWNRVMRGGDINGEELHDGIVCPMCFASLAERMGVTDGSWRFWSNNVLEDLPITTPSGRVWNPETWMWEEPANA